MISGVVALLAIIGAIGVRALKRSLDESTIAALERNNKAIAEERDQERRKTETLGHEVDKLRSQLTEQEKVIDVLRSTVQGREDIAAMQNLVTAQHQEEMQCLDVFKSDWTHFAENTTDTLRDIKRLAGITQREGDPNGEDAARD